MKYIVFVLSSIFISAVHGATYTDLHLNTDERPPFEFIGSDGKLEGVAVDVITCALDKLDVNYDIKVVPWSRAQKLVEAGDADGFFAASQSESRDQYARLSTVAVDQYWNWYLSPSIELSPSSPGFKADIKVSSWLGANSLKWLNNNGYNVKQPSKNNKELIKRLLGGRLDGVLSSDIVFERSLRDLGINLSELKVVKGMFKPMGVYFAKTYLNNNPGFLTSFNQATERCKGHASGGDS